MIGDLVWSDRGTDREESRLPNPQRLLAVKPDCADCSQEHLNGIGLGCGDGWYCTRDCEELGEHIARDQYACLHFRIEVIS